MKKHFKKALAALMALVMVVCLLAGCGNAAPAAQETPAPAEAPAAEASAAETPAEEPAKGNPAFTLKLSHTNKDGGGTDLASKDFKRILEEAGVNVTIDIYGNSQLGAESAVLESMMAGAVDVQVISTSVLASVIPSAYVMNVPFLFASVDQFWDVVNTDAFAEKFASGFEAVGLHYIGFLNCNERALGNNKHPVHTPDDLKGMNIRVLEGAVYTDLFGALGCSTSIVAVTELFTALQQGMVDGEDLGISYLVPNGYVEVEKYYTDTNHTMQPLCCVINLDKWNQMTDEQHAAIESAVKEAGELARVRYYEELDGYFETAEKDYGIEIVRLTDEERQLFKDAVAEVAAKYADFTPECRALYDVVVAEQAKLG